MNDPKNIITSTIGSDSDQSYKVARNIHRIGALSTL